MVGNDADYDQYDEGSHSDATGRFPLRAASGAERLLISTFKGYIHIEPLAGEKATDYADAYKRLFAFYTQKGHAPEYQRIDNHRSKLSNEVEKVFAALKVAVQYVPAHNHRTLRAERAIRTVKNRLVSGLAIADPDFPLKLWDESVPQLEITINTLGKWKGDSKTSAYKGMHGHDYDFDAHPIMPFGMKGYAYASKEERESFESKGVEAWYLGPSLQQYRCWKVYCAKTRAVRYTDTIAVLPTRLHMPGSKPLEATYALLESIDDKLRSGSPDSKDVQDIRDAIAEIRATQGYQPNAREQRVSLNPTPANTQAQESAREQRVPQGYTPQPTDSKRKERQVATKIDATFRKAEKKDFTKQGIHLKDWEHLPFQDTDEGIPFQAAGTYVRKDDTHHTPRLYVRYYDTTQHTQQAPTTEDKYEFTPWNELLKWHQAATRWKPKSKSWAAWAKFPPHFVTQAAMILRATQRLAGKQFFANGPTEQNYDITPAAHVVANSCQPNGTTQATPARKTKPKVQFDMQSNISYKHKHWTRELDSHQMNSTFHSTANDAPINVNADGTKLTMKQALTGPKQAKWNAAEGVEISRLLDTATMRPIHRCEIPADRRKDITYANPKPQEKLNEHGDVIERIRTTFGGDKSNYEGATACSVAEKALINIHQQGVLAKRLATGRNIRYATGDIRDFYVSGGTKLDRLEYMSISVKRIPSETRMKYNLNDFIDNGHILFEVSGTMYGHMASGRLANLDLVEVLLKNGYIQNENVPCLFENPETEISFTLVVDDLGIMYDADKPADLKALEAIIGEKWELKMDMSGSKYVGITLEWDYARNLLTTSMPAYIPAALRRFCPKGLPKGASTPSFYETWTPGPQNQDATEDTSPQVSAAHKLFIQQVAWQTR
jgi:hypothetical protein